MNRPRLLDLFCGAGGAAMGYYRAGFDVVGVDIKPQPRYPFEFVQGDALEYCAAHGAEFDAIHASPPCQAYSASRTIRGYTNHPDLVAPTRAALVATGKPYVIENVKGAPLVEPLVVLYGTMFGLRTMRQRLFEYRGFDMPFTLAPSKPAKSAKMGRIAKPDQWITIAGKGGARGTKQQWMDAIGIDWMCVEELAQAIPPAYTEYIGRQLLQALNHDHQA